MLRTVLAGALASSALLAGGGAHAQGYGYEPYRPHGFTLAGARAGVTVLGVDLDGSAKVTLGASGWGHGGHRGGYAPSYAPPPPPEAPVYEQAPPPPGYWMGYSAPGYGCGCAPPPPPPCCGY